MLSYALSGSGLNWIVCVVELESLLAKLASGTFLSIMLKRTLWRWKLIEGDSGTAHFVKILIYFPVNINIKQRTYRNDITLNFVQLLTMDISVLATMKNAAKCDT